MKLRISDIENFLIFIFFLVLPFEKRHIFFNFGYQYADFSAISFYASDIIVLILIIFYFTRPAFIKNLLKNSAFLILLGFIILELIISPRGTYTLFSELKWLELIIIFGIFCFANVSYETILKSISVSGLFQALISMAQFVKQQSLGLSLLGEIHIDALTPGIAKIATKSGILVRSYGTFAHPNQLAAFLVVACATTIILLYLEKDRFQSFFYGLVIFLLILAELLTFSRAGWGALLISLILLVFIPRVTKSAPDRCKYKVLGVIIAFVASILILRPLLVNRLSVSDPSVISRLYYDRVGLQLWEKHPFKGVGIGNLVPASAKIENFGQVWLIQPPHNYFIDVACETGLIGLIAIIYIFGKLLFGLFQKIWTGRGDQKLFKIFLLSVFISFLLLMQFDHYFYTLQQTQLLLWSILGIIGGTVFRETQT